MNQGMFSSEYSGYSTPQVLFDELDREFHFDIDVCATADNAKCERYFTPAMDGLKQPWRGACFCNPPYGRQVQKWVKKARTEADRGATVVCLLPARTDTRWFHEYCAKAEVRFLRGRVKFERDGKAGPAPFPSMIVVFKPKGVWMRYRTALIILILALQRLIKERAFI